MIGKAARFGGERSCEPCRADEHQAANALGLFVGEPEGDAGAHRHAAEDDVVELERVEQRREIARERPEVQAVRRPEWRGVAVAAALQAHQAARAAPQRSWLGGVAAEPVLEHEWVPTAFVEVGERESVRAGVRRAHARAPTPRCLRTNRADSGTSSSLRPCRMRGPV